MSQEPFSLKPEKINIFPSAPPLFSLTRISKAFKRHILKIIDENDRIKTPSMYLHQTVAFSPWLLKLWYLVCLVLVLDIHVSHVKIIFHLYVCILTSLIHSCCISVSYNKCWNGLKSLTFISAPSSFPWLQYKTSTSAD